MTTGHTVTNIKQESALIVKNKIKEMGGIVPSALAVTGRLVTHFNHVFVEDVKVIHVDALEEFITYVQ